MGIVGSKDEYGTHTLARLPPGFLDRKGRDLRDKLDECLNEHMWYFTVGGLLLTIPICFKYKTERPLFAAAIVCPVADMYWGTARCVQEKNDFVAHYNLLHQQYDRKYHYLQRQQMELERQQDAQQQQQQEQRAGTQQQRKPP